MEIDEQQQPPPGQADAGNVASGMRESDLKAQEGVGRCYYTQLPRLVKVSLLCTSTGLYNTA